MGGGAMDEKCIATPDTRIGLAMSIAKKRCLAGSNMMARRVTKDKIKRQEVDVS